MPPPPTPKFYALAQRPLWKHLETVSVMPSVLSASDSVTRDAWFLLDCWLEEILFTYILLFHPRACPRLVHVTVFLITVSLRYNPHVTVPPFKCTI